MQGLQKVSSHIGSAVLCMLPILIQTACVTTIAPLESPDEYITITEPNGLIGISLATDSRFKGEVSDVSLVLIETDSNRPVRLQARKGRMSRTPQGAAYAPLLFPVPVGRYKATRVEAYFPKIKSDLEENYAGHRMGVDLGHDSESWKTLVLHVEPRTFHYLGAIHVSASSTVNAATSQREIKILLESQPTAALLHAVWKPFLPLISSFDSRGLRLTGPERNLSLVPSLQPTTVRESASELKLLQTKDSKKDQSAWFALPSDSEGLLLIDVEGHPRLIRSVAFANGHLFLTSLSAGEKATMRGICYDRKSLCVTPEFTWSDPSGVQARTGAIAGHLHILGTLVRQNEDTQVNIRWNIATTTRTSLEKLAPMRSLVFAHPLKTNSDLKITWLDSRKRTIHSGTEDEMDFLKVVARNIYSCLESALYENDPMSNLAASLKLSPGKNGILNSEVTLIPGMSREGASTLSSCLTDRLASQPLENNHQRFKSGLYVKIVEKVEVY